MHRGDRTNARPAVIQEPDHGQGLSGDQVADYQCSGNLENVTLPADNRATTALFSNSSLFTWRNAVQVSSYHDPSSKQAIRIRRSVRSREALRFLGHLISSRAAHQHSAVGSRARKCDSEHRLQVGSRDTVANISQVLSIDRVLLEERSGHLRGRCGPHLVLASIDQIPAAVEVALHHQPSATVAEELLSWNVGLPCNQML